ncbi:hypothetical protein DPEC_G00252200 [Dallia pectoralis]|uniref:Uncharacterized protein n=1 Tax=Dallia pectoralis TaxID=75939 RepID=A0ACC2FTI0_DALPE|nr:hypothetical protein DPEC_G00252200 [Dallia pectoralis]
MASHGGQTQPTVPFPLVFSCSAIISLMVLLAPLRRRLHICLVFSLRSASTHREARWSGREAWTPLLLSPVNHRDKEGELLWRSYFCSKRLPVNIGSKTRGATTSHAERLQIYQIIFRVPRVLSGCPYTHSPSPTLTAHYFCSGGLQRQTCKAVELPNTGITEPSSRTHQCGTIRSGLEWNGDYKLWTH